MKRELVTIDSQLWNTFTEAVLKQGKQPQRVLAKLIRDYLEVQEDHALYSEMRKAVRPRQIDDTEAVALVHRYRREKQSTRSQHKR